MVSPGIVNPSIAMKCITQIPVMPIEMPATISHLARAGPVLTRDLLVQRKPRNEPRNDIRYARAGVSKPYEKLWIVSMRISPTTWLSRELTAICMVSAAERPPNVGAGSQAGEDLGVQGCLGGAAGIGPVYLVTARSRAVGHDLGQ